MKKSIVTIVAFMLFALAGFAQESYQFSIVKLVTLPGYAGSVDLSFSNNSETVYLPVTKASKYSDLIKKVEELSTSGWEVYNSTEISGENGNIITYFLKRKVK